MSELNITREYYELKIEKQVQYLREGMSYPNTTSIEILKIKFSSLDIQAMIQYLLNDNPNTGILGDIDEPIQPR